MAKVFKCTVCGYVHVGDAAPGKCPKCGQPQEKYEALSEDAGQLAVRASKTNLLHMQIVDLLSKAADLAQEGVNDNLDPACVKVFQSVIAQAVVLKGMSLAELEGHMKKGKWGL